MEGLTGMPNAPAEGLEKEVETAGADSFAAPAPKIEVPLLFAPKALVLEAKPPNAEPAAGVVKGVASVLLS